MAFSSWRTWVTGEVVTAAHMNQEIRDNGDALFPDEVTAASWTPTLEGATTNPGGVSSSGRQYRIGALQFVWARFVFGSGGSGVWFVELPVAASGITASASSGSGQAIGSWTGRDNSSTGQNETGVVALRTSTAVHFQRSVGGVVANDNPFTWFTDDVLTFHAVYPVA